MIEQKFYKDSKTGIFITEISPDIKILKEYNYWKCVNTHIETYSVISYNSERTGNLAKFNKYIVPNEADLLEAKFEFEIMENLNKVYEKLEEYKQ